MIPRTLQLAKHFTFVLIFCHILCNCVVIMVEKVYTKATQYICGYIV